MQVHELVARCAAAARGEDSMNAVRGVLEDLRGDLGAVERALAFIPGVGGNARQVFYRSSNLTMLKVCFPCGRRTPPHDHGTWAVILDLSGRERNTLDPSSVRRSHRQAESNERSADLRTSPDANS